jgi:hypothetical protein
MTTTIPHGNGAASTVSNHDYRFMSEKVVARGAPIVVLGAIGNTLEVP